MTSVYWKPHKPVVSRIDYSFVTPGCKCLKVETEEETGDGWGENRPWVHCGKSWELRLVRPTLNRSSHEPDRWSVGNGAQQANMGLEFDSRSHVVRRELTPEVFP